MNVEQQMESTHEATGHDQPKGHRRDDEAQRAAVVEAAYILEAIRK
jgi:hypothetical protein